MIISYNTISLIDFLGLVQGILFGVLLIIWNRKSRPSLLLGLFLITYAVEILDAILSDTLILSQKPMWLFLPFNFYFLTIPLFYLYVKSLTGSFSLKKNWLILLPGVLEFFAFLVLFLQPVATKLSLTSNNTFQLFYGVYEFVTLIYSIFFAVMTVRLVNRHQKAVLNYFSNTEKKQLKWVKAVAVFVSIFYALWFLPILFPNDFMGEVILPTFSAINVFFIYWVGISGLRQPKVEMKLASIREKTIQKTTQSETVQEKESDEIYQKLLDLMEERQLFKDSDLTLPLLAKQLKITRRKLSQIINQKTQSNFNHFINQYRVEEAKKILNDPNFDHLNMLGVAYEVGFNSKATFFSVFKKFEGSPPGVYKKHSV